MPGRFYANPFVRDLAWAGFSPLLMRGAGLAGAGLESQAFWRSRLRQLDADPSTLYEFLGNTPNGRLGLYYERLWHYLLKHDPDTDLLANNLPVRDGHRTVGEFDCLYWCRRRERHVHLELAVKFYLGVPDLGLWFGPGRHDRLDRKLHRLVTHQSRLARHPAAGPALRELGITECISAVDIKGYLFAPPAGMPAPDHHNPDNPLQTWYTLSQFSTLDPLPDGWRGWQEIPRHRWLSPHRVSDGCEYDSQEMRELLGRRLQPGGRPIQLAACDPDGREHRRCFVTPDDWAAHARANEQ